MARKPYTEERGAAVLEAARNMSGPPFLTIAAELAGEPEAAAKRWLYNGLRDADDEEDTPIARFALAFRKLQAEWLDEKQATILTLGAQEARSLQWQCERLRRDLFDLTRAPKHAAPGDSELPKQKRKGNAAATAAELAAKLSEPDEIEGTDKSSLQ